MNPRCIAAFLLVACWLAPVAQAETVDVSLSWLPQWIVDLTEWICAILGAENPPNTTQNVGPIAVPTG